MVLLVTSLNLNGSDMYGLYLRRTVFNYWVDRAPGCSGLRAPGCSGLRAPGCSGLRAALGSGLQAALGSGLRAAPDSGLLRAPGCSGLRAPGSSGLGSTDFMTCEDPMVFILLDGYSFHYAHIWIKSGISICGRHLVTSKKSSIFFQRRYILHISCVTCFELPSYISSTEEPDNYYDRKTCFLG